MGGGTELALACDYRVGLDSSSTKIGLPEVKLGIHPAYGGLVRSTAIINPLNSLEIMLSGRALAMKQAKAIGLIDLVQGWSGDNKFPATIDSTHMYRRNIACSQANA